MNHPLDEVLATAEEVIARGGRVYQKFTCAGCGQRLAMTVPDTFYKTGECDTCGAVTNLEETGCNYIAVFDRSGKGEE
jgi:hypothetical protein